MIIMHNNYAKVKTKKFEEEKLSQTEMNFVITKHE